MAADIFIDTNILVYAYDNGHLGKQTIARQLLLEGIERETITLSTQVLCEFVTVITTKIRNPIPLDDARKLINEFSIVPVVEINLTTINRAIETMKRYRLSFWDALIVAAAEQSGCRMIYSEDMSAGQSMHGVRIVNPFAKSA